MTQPSSLLKVALCALTLSALSPAAPAQLETGSLSQPRQQVASVTVGGISMFAGGRDVTTMSDVIDIYDASTGDWSTDVLPSGARTGIMAASVGPWILFAGGATSLTTSTDTIDVFSILTQTWSTASLSQARFNGGVATLGSKVFFAGGSSAGAIVLDASSRVDIYDSSMGAPSNPLAWSTAVLSEPRGAVAGATVGDQVIFAGGVIGSGPTVVTTVDIFDESDGLWTTADLSQARIVGQPAAATVGSRAWFGGGTLPGGVPSDVVDIYDESTGSWSTETLSVARQTLVAVGLDDKVLFAGGAGAMGTSDLIEVYDTSNSSWAPSRQLSAARSDMGGTVVAGRAAFAGGFDGASSDVVDFIELSWADLGGGTSGAEGQPQLNGKGPLVGGTSTSISLANAPAAAPMIAWLSFASAPFAALGGTVHAFPFNSQFFFSADGAGSFSGSTAWPLGIPPGTQIWFQFIVQDATSIHGLTLSNGVVGTTP